MTCTVTSPAELVCLVPYLVGFQPADSLVSVWVSPQGRLALTARVDLAAALHPAAWRSLVERMQLSSGASACFLVAYAEDRISGANAVRQAATALDVELIDACVVVGGRWWSALCCEDDGCPDEGYPVRDEGNRVAAEAVAAGISPLASREELAVRVAGPAGSPELDQALAAVSARLSARERGEWPGRLCELLDERLADVEAPLSQQIACELALLLTDPPARDIAWAALDHDSARALRRVWQDVVDAVPADVAAGPLCQLGMAGWVSGDGALLSVCLERAEEVCPEFGSLPLLRDVVAAAAPPSLWGTVTTALRTTAAAS